MSEIVSLFTVLSPHLSAATLRQFCEIVFAVLAMTRGVTMRNISRWTSKGGSYRTIQLNILGLFITLLLKLDPDKVAKVLKNIDAYCQRLNFKHEAI